MKIYELLNPNISRFVYLTVSFFILLFSFNIISRINSLTFFEKHINIKECISILREKVFQFHRKVILTDQEMHMIKSLLILHKCRKDFEIMHR